MSLFGQKMVVIVPVASVRVSPYNYAFGTEHDILKTQKTFGRFWQRFVETLNPEFRDPDQDSQVLYGEIVDCLERVDNGYIRIKLDEQYIFNKALNSFEHSTGYLKEQYVMAVQATYKPTLVVKKPWVAVQCSINKTLELPMGSVLCLHSETDLTYTVKLPDGTCGTVAKSDIYKVTSQLGSIRTLQNNIIQSACTQVGGSYCWGGRSPHGSVCNDCAHSTDCSGLVNVAYRACGLLVPRNTVPQWLGCHILENGMQLKPGDLIFFAPHDNPTRINHVVMYIGNEMIIESCLEGIIKRKLVDRLGVERKMLVNGCIVETGGLIRQKVAVYLGTYIGDSQRLKLCRMCTLKENDVTAWIAH